MKIVAHITNPQMRFSEASLKWNSEWADEVLDETLEGVKPGDWVVSVSGNEFLVGPLQHRATREGLESLIRITEKCGRDAALIGLHYVWHIGGFIKTRFDGDWIKQREPRLWRYGADPENALATVSICSILNFDNVFAADRPKKKEKKRPLLVEWSGQVPKIVVE